MKKSKKMIPVIYLTGLLLCCSFQSCGEDEEPIFGSYLEIESGYKNCTPGAFSEQIEVNSDRGICWRWGGNSFSECFTAVLTLTPEFTFMRTSSGIKYYDDDTTEDGLQSESMGTFTHEGNLINLFEETRFGTDTTVLRIEMDGTLNTINASLLNCEQHSIYRRQ